MRFVICSENFNMFVLVKTVIDNQKDYFCALNNLYQFFFNEK